MGKEQDREFTRANKAIFWGTQREKEHFLLPGPFRLVAYEPPTITVQALLDWNPGHVYSLHHRPHNGETTGFGGEGINLIGSLSHIAEKAFDGVGRANVAMHDLRKGVKREQMLFILHQASDCLRIALLVLALEGG